MVGFQHYLVRPDTICLWIRCGIRNDTSFGLKKNYECLLQRRFCKKQIESGEIRGYFENFSFKISIISTLHGHVR